MANWSGTWPGLVGMLNLNGSLTKAGRQILDPLERGFHRQAVCSLQQWLEKGTLKHKTDHVVPLAR